MKTLLSPAWAVFGLAGCSSVQSVMDPRGPDADIITRLAMVLIIGAAAILALIVGLTIAAIFGSNAWRQILRSELAVVVGGVAFPVAVLSALLVYNIALLRPNVETPRQGVPLKISVQGEQWWWRVRYDDGKRSWESANELRIPIGRRIELSLTSKDVIHSFWVPGLGGKLDMIPGRTTGLTLAASESGTFRGQCAEYCGGPHGLMALRVVALEEDAFIRWLASESGPAREPDAELARRGQALVLAAGCGACHTIRGTSAMGKVGPDLTHLGGRLSIAADTLPMSANNLAQWIVDGQTLKPGNLMPQFRNLRPSEVRAMAAYLEGLE